MEITKQMEMVLYHSEQSDITVNAIIKDETIWITQKAMAELFGIDKSGISRHLSNIFKSGELDEKVVVAKIATTTQHGAIEGKPQSSLTNYYNLDAIISVGYRVDSKQALEKAYQEYDIFNRIQPIESDFDKVIKRISD